jgi:zinc protease
MRLAGSVVLVLIFLTVTPILAATVPPIDIPFQKFLIGNGLTLIVHEDHKAPVVAVNVWYHVGSKNEKEGKTGFAHLFEHLMFSGSEHFNSDYLTILDSVGGTHVNGTTNEDRTSYFQNVPTNALDSALWLESDRMGHLLGVVDQARLDKQRGVVENEKRQGEDWPYAVSKDLIARAVFPAGHPYAHTVIGSMADLSAASLADVREWFRSYYGPSNAVLVLAGDIDAATARQKVEKYFGDIPPGPPVSRYQSWVAKRTGSQYAVAEDRVPQARLYRVWNVPGYGTAENAYLNLLTWVLVSNDKGSRLYKRLVHDDQIATDVDATLEDREIGSLFTIVATGTGEDLTAVRKEIDEELARLLAEGPTDDEMSRARAQFFASFVRDAERIGGFGGKSDILAESQAYGGAPDAYKKKLQLVAGATPADLQRAGRAWLSDGLYELAVVPFPNYAPAAEGANRSKMPEAGPAVPSKFPSVERATLSNGLQLLVAERHNVPLVYFSLMVDAGFSSDPAGLPGVASLAMPLFVEGTSTRSGIQISSDLARLGATLDASSNLDTSMVNISAVTTTIDDALTLYADVILHPAFSPSDFERLRKLQIAAIQLEKTTAAPMALRILPRLIYGAAHAYGNPMTGSGTEASVAKITRDDVERFYRTFFKPNNASLIIVGDTTLVEMRPKLEALFAPWKGGDVPKKNIASVTLNAKTAVYLVDRPGSQQSTIVAGVIAPPKSNPHEAAIETMNTVLGVLHGSRINMNLRENKHWSYGAVSTLPDARAQRIFIARAPVQTDKTKESLVEMNRELHDIVGDRAVTAGELAMAKANRTLRLPGRWETDEQVAAGIGQMVQFHLSPDYFDTYAARVNALTLQDVTAAAHEVVRADNLIWIVVGDRSKVERGIRELNLGELHFVDADGNAVK